MAVYTEVSDADLRSFLDRYGIGSAVACTGIAEGIENTNYRLSTTAGTFILTLFERRVAAADLPFFVNLMEHLAAQGVPCPLPVRDRDGIALQTLCGRPALIVTCLEGAWPRDVGAVHCAATGAALADLHRAGRSFDDVRANDLGMPSWRPLFVRHADRADELAPGFADWIDAELTALESAWPATLPVGLIHADLFPDNVFFEGEVLTGVIDFYFACTDWLAFDLAIALNAWCFAADGTFRPAHAARFVAGYQEVRPLEEAEKAALPVLGRGAAMRFLLTRLHDWFETADGPLTARKDPTALRPVIRFHRAATGPADYGIR